MNSSALSTVVGNYTNGTFLFGTLVDSSGNLTYFNNNSSLNIAYYNSTAINNSGDVIALGTYQSTLLGTKVNATGDTTNLPYLSIGIFTSTAMNDSGFAVLGGSATLDATGVYLASLAPGSTAYTTVVAASGASSNILSVAINSSGNAIGGGVYLGNRYAALFNASVSSPPVTVVSLPTGGQINSVAINNAGTSIIGGTTNANAAYATLIGPSGLLQPLTGTLPSSGAIKSVDINSSIEYAILGGQDTTGSPAAYAAFVSPSGQIYPISGLPTGSGASINSVSINPWGVSLLGGTSDGTTPYAALAAPWGGLAEIDVDGLAPITTVSIRNYFPFNKDNIQNKISQLLGRVRAVTGNNLIFGEYITSEAPHKILYFIPSVFADTLDDALQNAAPTRNALSLFAVNNNLFFLNNSLTAHNRNRVHSKTTSTSSSSMANNTALLAWRSFSATKNKRMPSTSNSCQQKPRSFTLWLEPIGALISQQEQNQTVGFQPSVIVGLLGLEYSFDPIAYVGGGVAYTFTHIHEEEDSGFSNINQEYLFLCGGWSQWNFYIDAAVWGGLFQTNQARLIHMTGFDFRSNSSPHGTQVSPHLEMGYNLERTWGSRKQFTAIVDPFAMIDWPNSWQERFTETGDGPFNATQKANHSSFLRVESGLRFYETVRFQVWRITLEEKGSYVYRHPYHFGSVEAFLVGSPGSFTLETLTSTQSLGAVEASCMFEPLHPVYPYGWIGYQGEFGIGYQSHQLTAEIGWKF